jgi:hypothetical protein
MKAAHTGMKAAHRASTDRVCGVAEGGGGGGEREEEAAAEGCTNVMEGGATIKEGVEGE